MELPTVSIFTPTHNPKRLIEAYQSIKDQDFLEWVILYNNGATPIGFDDPRVKEVIDTHDGDDSAWIGRLKHEACASCIGDILLELDHDDLLMPLALEHVREAFLDVEIGFVYSNTIHANADLTTSCPRFDERYGWKYRQVNVNGNLLDEHISFDPLPTTISRIWYAPNHLRAFRRSLYEQIGGYNVGMRVLDDLDLMCRLYAITKFRHINEGLYIYRYEDNTFAKDGINQEIQNNVYRIHDMYIESLAESWSTACGLRKIELGGRLAARPGFETVDLFDADIIADLNSIWPFKDNSVGVIRAYDVFEHLKNPIFVMNELHRVLAPGGYAIIQVPSTEGTGAASDPTHVSWWNERSFTYYTQAERAKYLPDFKGRFQALRLFTTEPDAERCCWVQAHLMKLDNAIRVPGEVLI